MVKRNDKEPSSENYPFIKETIKERPADRKMLLHKFLTAAVCGVILGGCAAGTVALILPEVAPVSYTHLLPWYSPFTYFLNSTIVTPASPSPNSPRR